MPSSCQAADAVRRRRSWALVPWPFDLLRQREPEPEHERAFEEAQGLVALTLVALVATLASSIVGCVLAERLVGTDTALILERCLLASAALLVATLAVVTFRFVLGGRSSLKNPCSRSALAWASRHRAVAWSGAWFLLLAAVAAKISAAGIGSDVARARVAYLADSPTCGPLWLHRLAACRLEAHDAPAGMTRSRVAVADLDVENLATALANAEMVVVASHGRGGVIEADGRLIGFSDIRRMRKGSRLRFVYLASCDLGVARADWEKALSPARVMLYDRRTSAIEHLRWLLSDAPNCLDGS